MLYRYFKSYILKPLISVFSTLRTHVQADGHQHHSHNGHHHGHSHGHHHHDNHWLKASLGLIWGLLLLGIAIATPAISALSYSVLTVVSTLMTLYLGRSVYQSAWHALRKKKWNMATLYSISTLMITAVSIISLLIPGLPMMFEAAPLVLGFWHLGEGIEHTLLDKINEKLDVRDCVPCSVILKGKSDRQIFVKDLKPKQIIEIENGQVIPVDGVLKKASQLYTTRIDGSPYPKSFKIGDRVKAGMKVAEHDQPITMRVSKTYKDSYLSLIAQNIKKAHNEKAPIELLVDRVLKYFIPGLLLVAFSSGVIISLLFNPAMAIQCVVTVLVSACPCALSLITPMAVKIGMKKASDNGIIFKNGKALQAAADIDTLVFDLNGTLTQGEIAIQSFHINDQRILPHIALLESQSEHPVGRLIKAYIEKLGIESTEPLVLSSVNSRFHSGITGIINGEQFMVGNRDLLLANNINLNSRVNNIPMHGSLYIVHNGTVIGHIVLTDPLRKDAITTIKKLKASGKNIHICTGSDQYSAEQYAQLLDIPINNICTNTVGAVSNFGETSKTSYIEALKRQGHKVAMIGDAANDVAAIACADLGIAVKSTIGDAITEQHAGIVLQQGLLFPIAMAFDIAHKTKQNIYQNLFVSLTYNSTITLLGAGLLAAIGFTIGPVMGIALTVVESTALLINIYRLKQQRIISNEDNCEIVNTERTEFYPIHEEQAPTFAPQYQHNRSLYLDKNSHNPVCTLNPAESEKPKLA